ncbi:hypothetical protein BRADI_2g51291v3 [Brachypodium distachyon]|uniref:Late embryogenesis abundant protein LEA-2 subgroup domain-containing protein n=1 Tax=Brachypodium distachyon TaxID=15368 RepID=A0A2K2DF87_BRADI|nr:hypothetical protein BRADI_2g51291v3 [Brachypodium distachyon]
MEAGGNFLRRHPRLELALFLSVLGCYIFVGCWMIRGPPEFSATVTSFEGLDRSTSTAGAAAAPTFRVDLRPAAGGAVTVAYDGVPLARAGHGGFCVPARGVVRVLVVATGDGLGLPARLHDSLESRRQRGERVPLDVRLRLDEEHVVPHNWNMPMLLRCAAVLDGRPTEGPSRCSLSVCWSQVSLPWLPFTARLSP